MRDVQRVRRLAVVQIMAKHNKIVQLVEVHTIPPSFQPRRKFDDDHLMILYLILYHTAPRSVKRYPPFLQSRAAAPFQEKSPLQSVQTDSQRALFCRIYTAALAFSHRAVKAAGSWMAISLRTLRFRSMPDFFRPFMNVE